LLAKVLYEQVLNEIPQTSPFELIDYATNDRAPNGYTPDINKKADNINHEVATRLHHRGEVQSKYRSSDMSDVSRNRGYTVCNVADSLHSPIDDSTQEAHDCSNEAAKFLVCPISDVVDGSLCGGCGSVDYVFGRVYCGVYGFFDRVSDCPDRGCDSVTDRLSSVFDSSPQRHGIFLPPRIYGH
jgi:hypothetical protein